MNKKIIKADSRGESNLGWLKAKFSFSFANYYNPEKIHFGALRVLNNDVVQQGMGFGTHPHQNMEIITIPLSGSIQHKDSIGNTSIIKKGEIQVMSAGTGIYHSEFNPSATEELELLQIWVIPNQMNVEPRYDQISIEEKLKINEITEILSPEKKENTVWIYQNAWFSIGKFDKSFTSNYTLNQSENGVYLFVIQGSIEVENEVLNNRDAMEITSVQEFNLKALTENAELLIIEVPMIKI